MKKITLLTTAFMAGFSLISFGQNGNGGNGNNGNGNSNGIGSSSNPYDELYINNHLKVGTNSIWLDAGAENRLFTTTGTLLINGNWPAVGAVPASLGQNTVINPTGGHVGVGKAIPTAKLDVEMDITYLTVHESGLRVTYPNLFGAPPSDGTPINESIFEVREKFPSTGDFTSRLIVKSNGNVGISTAEPTYRLHVVNPNVSSGTAIRADAINGHIRLFETDGSAPATNFTQIERNGDAFHIYQNDGSAYQHVLSATMNGNVGLGNTSPTYKLHVTNTNTASGTAIRADAINGHIRLFETDGSAPTTNFTQIERNGDAFHIYQNDGSAYQHVLTAKMNGNIGMGTATPQASLHILTNDNTSLKIETTTYNNADIALKSGSGQSDILNYNTSDQLTSILRFNDDGFGSSMTFTSYASGSNPVDNFKVTSSGITYAKEIIVQTSAFPDYVFSNEYNLMSLHQINDFIKANHHLPNIPSATEVESNGMAIGDMQVKQMEKIEELYLYIIDLNEKVEKLSEENIELKSKIHSLSSEKK